MNTVSYLVYYDFFITQCDSYYHKMRQNYFLFLDI